jgi:hypothetical protein
MSAKYIILWIVGGLVVFVAGGVAGYFYAWQASGLSPVPVVESQGQAASQLAKNLSSKVVPSVAAQGVVTKINGKSITLSSQGDSMVITMSNDVKVYAFVPNPNPSKTGSAMVSQQVDFSQIKEGDSVSVNLHVLSNGSLEGFSIVILPAPAAPVIKK